MNARSLTAWLVVALTAAGCALGTGGSAQSTDPAAPLDLAAPADLAAIVIAPGEPPDGMSLSDEGDGSATLEQLPLFLDTAAELRATPGFIDGRWSRFAGSAADFEASKNFVLTWVVSYASETDADLAVSILLDELQSEDHYGWGTGQDAGLGDEGTCLDAENPQLGGLRETICVWRRDTLVMVVGGGARNDEPVRDEAAALDARAAEFHP